MLQIEMYQEVLEDIHNRTGGVYADMSYADKLMTISISKEIKAFIDNYMAEQYPIIKMWASLSALDIALDSKEPDISRFKINNNMIMGGRF